MRRTLVVHSFVPISSCLFAFAFAFRARPRRWRLTVRPRRPAPYVFDTDQAADMAKAGADVLVPHMGLTSSGTIGAQTTITLQDAALRVQGMHDAAKKVNPDSGAVDTCFSTASYKRRTA